ncbi:MAG: hypothetical protein IJU57_05765 [Clostridia bacterium]|nr:hypothetical protein [Clostridia bacterium]
MLLLARWWMNREDWSAQPRLVEYSYIQFERGISIPAWLFATLITALFALTVYFAALRKVRHLKLTDMN